MKKLKTILILLAMASAGCVTKDAYWSDAQDVRQGVKLKNL